MMAAAEVVEIVKKRKFVITGYAVIENATVKIAVQIAAADYAVRAA